jgi:hypothetical protein
VPTFAEFCWLSFSPTTEPHRAIGVRADQDPSFASGGERKRTSSGRFARRLLAIAPWAAWRGGQDAEPIEGRSTKVNDLEGRIQFSYSTASRELVSHKYLADSPSFKRPASSGDTTHRKRAMARQPRLDLPGIPQHVVQRVKLAIFFTVMRIDFSGELKH